MELVDGLLSSVAARLRGDHRMFDPGGCAMGFGFTELLTPQLKQAAGVDPLRALVGEGAAAARAVMDQMLDVTRSHVGAVLARDLSCIESPQQVYHLSVDQVCLLALPYGGKAARDATLLRRRQALQLIAALGHTLRQPTVSAAVDDGVPLLPVLAEVLCQPVAAVRALGGVGTVKDASATPHADQMLAVLASHDVPLAEWSGQRRLDQSTAWPESLWLEGASGYGSRPLLLFRRDYMPD